MSIIFPAIVTAATGALLLASRSKSAAPVDPNAPIKTGTAPSGTDKVKPDQTIGLIANKGTDLYDIANPPQTGILKHKTGTLPQGHAVRLLLVQGPWVRILVPAAKNQPAFEGWVRMNDVSLAPV